MTTKPSSPASTDSTIDITSSTISTTSYDRPFCVICQDDAAEDTYCTKCEHLFCRPCIMEHLMDHVRCPQCRTVLAEGQSKPNSPTIIWAPVNSDGEPEDDEPMVDISALAETPADYGDLSPRHRITRFAADGEPLEEDEFEVRGLLDFERRRVLGRRQAYYLVRWQGFGPIADMWVAAERIECAGLKALFRRRMACHPGGSNRQVRRRRPIWSEAAWVAELPGYDESGRFIGRGGPCEERAAL